MISKECFVYIQLPGAHELVTVGRLKWEKASGSGRGTFVYGKSYLENPQKIALDPFNLPLEERTFECATNDGIFGAIRDASPDKWGRTVIEKHTTRDQWDEIGFLLNSAEDRVGALSFGINKVPPAPLRKFNKTVELESLIIAAHKIEENKEISAEEKRLLQGGMSMGGARPKTVVEEDHALWLAKFRSHDDRNDFPKIEYATMRMATDCGLNVPEIRLQKVGKNDVFLIKRFDREWDKHAESYFRTHFVSGLTLLNIGETEHDRFSYVDLADQMRRWIPKPKDDLRELYKRIIFNALVSNEDDHPRNHGFLFHSKGFRLSMVYDLVPRPRTGTHRYSAMAIGTDRTVFTKKNIFSKCSAFDFTETEAKGLFKDMAKKVAGWRRYFQEVDLSAGDFAYLEPAFNWGGLEYQ